MMLPTLAQSMGLMLTWKTWASWARAEVKSSPDPTTKARWMSFLYPWSGSQNHGTTHLHCVIVSHCISHSQCTTHSVSIKPRLQHIFLFHQHLNKDLLYIKATIISLFCTNILINSFKQQMMNILPFMHQNFNKFF